MESIRYKRLTPPDAEQARDLFQMVAQVFGEDSKRLSLAYVTELLSRADFLALGAFTTAPIGGLTAFFLPTTRFEGRELFIYDIAVHPSHQRRGIGQALFTAAHDLAHTQGAANTWLAADNEDRHALDFYRALGGDGCAVTMFTFG